MRKKQYTIVFRKIICAGIAAILVRIRFVRIPSTEYIAEGSAFRLLLYPPVDFLNFLFLFLIRFFGVHTRC